MVSLAMILHDHGSLGKILARSCQDLGKHTHASWQACQDSCHWVEFQTSEAAPKEQNINSLENNDATASGSVEIQEPGVVVDLRLNSALTAIILEVVGCTITAK